MEMTTDAVVTRNKHHRNVAVLVLGLLAPIVGTWLALPTLLLRRWCDTQNRLIRVGFVGSWVALLGAQRWVYGVMVYPEASMGGVLLFVLWLSSVAIGVGLVVFLQRRVLPSIRSSIGIAVLGTLFMAQTIFVSGHRGEFVPLAVAIIGWAVDREQALSAAALLAPVTALPVFAGLVIVLFPKRDHQLTAQADVARPGH